MSKTLRLTDQLKVIDQLRHQSTAVIDRGVSPTNEPYVTLRVASPLQLTLRRFADPMVIADFDVFLSRDGTWHVEPA